jgi:hypothetical protein
VDNRTADRLVAMRHDNVGGQPELHEPVSLRGLPHLIVHLPASSIHATPWPSRGLSARSNKELKLTKPGTIPREVGARGMEGEAT